MTARILGIGTARPSHRITQQEAREFARSMFGPHHRDIDRLLPVFDHAGVHERYFCTDADWFTQEHTFEERHRLYVEHAEALSMAAVEQACIDADVAPSDIGAVFFVSSTGMATPSLDARLALALGCPATVRRDATFGHGCAGGVGGLARAATHARDHPGSLVLLVATELCGLTFRRGTWSKANLIATSLFADGAAAVIVGTDGPGAQIVADASVLWPGTIDVMGWTFVAGGMDVVLARSLPQLVKERLGATVDAVCERIGVSAADIDHFVMHPGGAKVLAAYGDVLACEAADLHHSREVLRTCGNMSAPTVFFVLEHLLAGDTPPVAGDTALMSAMGPGFAVEHVVLQW